MAKKIEVEDYGAALAEEILKISKSMDGTLLTEQALVILLAEKSGVTRLHTRAVLRAVPGLKDYLKREKFNG